MELHREKPQRLHEETSFETSQESFGREDVARPAPDGAAGSVPEGADPREPSRAFDELDENAEANAEMEAEANQTAAERFIADYRASLPKPEPDFWDESPETVVLERQPRTAVYTNTFDAVVIRQEPVVDDDPDSVVVIRPEHAERVAAAILREARSILGQPEPSRAPRATRACTRGLSADQLDLVGGGRP